MQPTDDYRSSHLERGGHYDTLLAKVPFDAYMADWERHHLGTLVRELFPAGVPRYLDFACGTGRATATVAPLAHKAVGVDISPSMLQVAGEKVPGATFHHADLTQEDPDLGSFDLITSFRFFGNAQDELREGVMRALVRRLLPGGYLIINSHRNPHALYSLLDRITGGDAGKMDLHLGKLRALLERHGLKIRRVRPIGAWMYRSRMLDAYRADDAVAVARERRWSHPMLAAIAPDAIVVAQRA
jgi:SAM-dependent methyltransferase